MVYNCHSYDFKLTHWQLHSAISFLSNLDKTLNVMKFCALLTHVPSAHYYPLWETVT